MLVPLTSLRGAYDAFEQSIGFIRMNFTISKFSYFSSVRADNWLHFVKIKGILKMRFVEVLTSQTNHQEKHNIYTDDDVRIMSYIIAVAHERVGSYEDERDEDVYSDGG
ncbi:hypothetical protein Tco_0452652 [Tanacetum coccineum]